MTELLSNKDPCNNCNLYNPCTGPCDKWHEWNSSVLSKLAAYETAEGEGRLVVLPCKVGYTVYTIEDKYYEYLYHKGIQKGHVCKFEYDKEWFAWIHIDGCNKDLQIAYKIRSFNKTVFFTREEAEKVLKDQMDFNANGKGDDLHKQV